MKRVILYIVLGALVVAGLVAAFRPLRQRAGQVATYLRVMSGDTGDVMSSANYQRFASRREAVLAMKAALLDVARVESLAVANSGRPVTTFRSIPTRSPCGSCCGAIDGSPPPPAVASTAR